MQKVVNHERDVVQEGIWIARVLLDIGSPYRAERLLDNMAQLLESNPDQAKSEEIGRLRDIVLEQRALAQELGGGPHCLFNFQHPIVTEVRAAMDIALVQRGHLWIESDDGWLTMDFEGLAPGFINLEIDKPAGLTIMEAVMVQPDGSKCPVRLRIPSNCAGPVGVLMATQFGAHLIPNPSRQCEKDIPTLFEEDMLTLFEEEMRGPFIVMDQE